MQINELLCHPTNYNKIGNRKIEYIVVHYTGNKGDTAENNAKYFSRTANIGASAHYFVDENDVWYSVPDMDRAWHCGANTYKHSKCRNSNSLGVEICMWDKAGKARQGSIDKAVALVRKLMDKYSVPPNNVIRHYDVTGKICPAPMVNDPELWNAFKTALTKQYKEQEEEDMTGKEIYEKLNEYLSELPVPDWAEEEFQKAIAAGITDGTRPMQLIPRYQAAIMAKRAINK